VFGRESSAYYREAQIPINIIFAYVDSDHRLLPQLPCRARKAVSARVHLNLNDSSWTWWFDYSALQVSNFMGSTVGLSTCLWSLIQDNDIALRQRSLYCKLRSFSLSLRLALSPSSHSNREKTGPIPLSVGIESNRTNRITTYPMDNPPKTYGGRVGIHRFCINKGSSVNFQKCIFFLDSLAGIQVLAFLSWSGLFGVASPGK